MKRYSIITYKLNNTVKPAEVLAEIEKLTAKHSVQYQDCLFKVAVPLIEYEFEEKVHSNRMKNAIMSICKSYPAAEPLFQRIEKDNGDGCIDTELLISNFSETDYSKIGAFDYSVICEIITKIPRPYNVNDLNLIFDGVSFAKENKNNQHIKLSPNGFGAPVGNYICYERSVYGSEKHSYILFSAEDAMLEDMRRLFFDFAERIPGKYEGVELQND